MFRWLTVLCLMACVTASAHAQLLLYPTGMINSRVPVIPTIDGGAKGKAFAAKAVFLAYDYGRQLGNGRQGHLTWDYRRPAYRRAHALLALGDGEHALVMGLKPASQGRTLQLQWGSYTFADNRFALSKTLQTVVSQTAPRFDWTAMQLTWDAGKVSLKYDGKEIATVNVDPSFNPTQLFLRAWCVDQLQLTQQNTLSLDWEQDYAARIHISQQQPDSAIRATLLGFDSFVVGTDPTKRDCPVLQINNPTGKLQQLTATYHVKREVTGKPWQWQTNLDVDADKSLIMPIDFPQPLGSDVYHMQVVIKNESQTVAVLAKHFLHTPRRDEPAGPAKFGLHDCNVRDFGFWPDALPINMAHIYLYWGYVQGPGWEKDWDGRYGLDPAISADQWNWNPRIDWASQQGREVFVCVQSTPFSDWARAQAYPHMRKYPWGMVGGYPKIDLYRNFLREAIKRYKGKVAAWEVENEPNAGTHIPLDKTDDYVQICKAVYEEIKPVDPAAKIFGISGTSSFQKWMEKVLAGGGSKYLDGVSWHTYTSPNTPDQVGFPTILKESVDIVHKTMPGAPIYNSETGVVVALRDQVDAAIPMEEVAKRVRQKDRSFVANSWMGAAFDEWHGGACMVSNAVYNFLAGVQRFNFFGWNPRWPTKPQWKGHPPFFTIISSSADGTRTPSLMTLAVANLTTQMQGALIKGSTPVKLDGVKGGIFAKANGGKIAVLWAPAGRQSVMLKTDAPTVQIVDMFGQSRTLPVKQGVVSCDVTDLPIYVHVAGKQLIVAPGPFDAVVVKADGPATGKCDVTITNRDAAPLHGTLQLAWHRGDGPLTPQAQPLDLAPGRSATLSFAYALQTDKDQKIDKPQIALTVEVVRAGSADSQAFHSTVDIPTRPVQTVHVSPRHIAMSQDHAAMINAMKQAHALDLKLDRLEQVQLGHPPALASLQDPKWWGGADELSADVKIAADEQGMVLLLDVLDVAARNPQTWPSVKGSVVELFFDFREPGKGLGDPRYGKSTFQVLLRPGLTDDVSEARAWSPQLGDMNVPVFSQYDKKTHRYWLAMRLPWSVIPSRSPSGVPGMLGFDLGLNAAPAGGPGRKTQMLLFGDQTAARNASVFGRLVLKH